MKKLLLSILLLFSIVILKGQSIGGITTGSQTYCDTINSGFISVTGYVGIVTTWLYTTDGGVSWTNNGNTFSTQPYYNINQTTCFAAVVTNGAFPPDTSTMACITIDTCQSVGLSEILNANITYISPNPSNGSLSVNSNTDLQKIEVATITGQILISEIPSGNTHLLHLNNLANGIYFVNVYHNNYIIKREKIILNK